MFKKPLDCHNSLESPRVLHREQMNTRNNGQMYFINYKLFKLDFFTPFKYNIIKIVVAYLNSHGLEKGYHGNESLSEVTLVFHRCSTLYSHR